MYLKRVQAWAIFERLPDWITLVSNCIDRAGPVNFVQVWVVPLQIIGDGSLAGAIDPKSLI